MADDASIYRFGDLLALARRSWVLAMTRELAARGYDEYRLTDAAAIRTLRRRSFSVGRLAEVLGVTRQAARKVVRGLEERSLAVTRADPDDARKLAVGLTERGVAYAEAVAEVIALLNGTLAQAVSPAALEEADRVLRAAITEPELARVAAAIPPPRG